MVTSGRFYVPPGSPVAWRAGAAMPAPARAPAARPVVRVRSFAGLMDVMPGGTANPAAATPGANAPVDVVTNPLGVGKDGWKRWVLIGGVALAALALGYVVGGRSHRT